MRFERLSDHVRMNKRHWNAIAKRERANKADMFRQVKDDASLYLEKWEPKIGPYLKRIEGKRIIVPQFGDGLVMLACAKMGAVVTGVDFSSEQIRLAREAAAYCGAEVDLVEADWQNLPKKIPNNHFDLVVTECGIFIWIADLDAWMRNAYKVLKKGGRLVVSDFHPLSIIAEEKNESVTFRKSYFDQGPKAYESEFWGDKDVPPAIEFLWKLSDIINAAIQAGFQINRVEEYYVEQKPRKVPLLPTDFLLVATKG
jgi:ubiquinone/menaquinone biosynthesis C-methylase UbiE